VKVESICLILYGFVRATEAKQVRGYGPMSGVPRPLIQVVKAHPIVSFQVFHVMG
jgi:hypothetical protein